MIVQMYTGTLYPPLRSFQMTQRRSHPLHLVLFNWFVWPSWPESPLLNPNPPTNKIRRRVLRRRNSLFTCLLRLRHSTLDSSRLTRLSPLPQIVQMRHRPGKSVCDAGDASAAAAGQSWDKPVRGPGIHGELVACALVGQTSDLSGITAGELHADDVGVLGEVGEKVGVHVDAVADGGELFHQLRFSSCMS